MRTPQQRRAGNRMRAYLKARKPYLEAHPHCAVCGHPSQQVHHKAGRGALLLDETKWLPVCGSCHQEITVNPAWAIEQGYSLSRFV